MEGSISDFSRRLIRWYQASRRDLPWRVPIGSPGRALPEPYHVLVSEAMLQQTQVSAVVPYFMHFIERFPTLQTLADAPEQDVLRLWQGLGYYSRARNLQAAARMVVSHFGGQIPCKVDDLLSLPGVGRYTAGAIASLAFNTPAPIVDGNVARVLCRVDCIRTDPRDKPTLGRLWARAAEIVPRRIAADFNSAMMELGATICTPRSPKCMFCPVQAHCEAFRAGLQEKIPVPRQARVTPLEQRWTFCLYSGNHWLVEQRPPRGRWASMWQFITLTADDTVEPSSAIRSRVNMPHIKLDPLGEVSHALTHRRYTFHVHLAEIDRREVARARWQTLEEIDRLPLPRPHLKIMQMLLRRTPS